MEHDASGPANVLPLNLQQLNVDFLKSSNDLGKLRQRLAERCRSLDRAGTTSLVVRSRIRRQFIDRLECIFIRMVVCKQTTATSCTYMCTLAQNQFLLFLEWAQRSGAQYGRPIQTSCAFKDFRAMYADGRLPDELPCFQGFCVITLQQHMSRSV